MRTGGLRDAISAYKYDDKWGWGHIFGRVLVGYLRVLRDVGVSYDLIIPMPTYVGQGGRSSEPRRGSFDPGSAEALRGSGQLLVSCSRDTPGFTASARRCPATTSTPRVAVAQGAHRSSPGGHG
jgi:hypothetical protein